MEPTASSLGADRPSSATTTDQKLLNELVFKILTISLSDNLEKTQPIDKEWNTEPGIIVCRCSEHARKRDILRSCISLEDYHQAVINSAILSHGAFGHVRLLLVNLLEVVQTKYDVYIATGKSMRAQMRLDWGGLARPSEKIMDFPEHPKDREHFFQDLEAARKILKAVKQLKAGLDAAAEKI